MRKGLNCLGAFALLSTLAAMFRGEPMMEMSAKPVGVEAAGSAPKKPASAAKPTPAAKAPKPAPDPHAGMNTNNNNM